MAEKRRGVGGERLKLLPTESPAILTRYASPDIRHDVDPKADGLAASWRESLTGTRSVTGEGEQASPHPHPPQSPSELGTQVSRHCACEGRGGGKASPDNEWVGGAGEPPTQASEPATTPGERFPEPFPSEMPNSSRVRHRQ